MAVPTLFVTLCHSLLHLVTLIRLVAPDGIMVTPGHSLPLFVTPCPQAGRSGWDPGHVLLLRGHDAERAAASGTRSPVRSRYRSSCCAPSVRSRSRSPLLAAATEPLSATCFSHYSSLLCSRPPAIGDCGRREVRRAPRDAPAPHGPLPGPSPAPGLPGGTVPHLPRIRRRLDLDPDLELPIWIYQTCMK